MMQLDLFAKPPMAFIPPMTEDEERAGWERRLLSDLAAGPLVYCQDGFMGHVAERLVARGLVVSEDAGFLAAPGKIKGYRKEDYPQRRYAYKPMEQAA
jgi:hypothetical protein